MANPHLGRVRWPPVGSLLRRASCGRTAAPLARTLMSRPGVGSGPRGSPNHHNPHRGVDEVSPSGTGRGPVDVVLS